MESLRSAWSWATKDSKTRMITAGAVRMIADLLTIFSGSGFSNVQSSFGRVCAGSLGLLSSSSEIALGFNAIADRMPDIVKKNRLELVSLTAMMAGMFLIKSGIDTGRPVEAFLGAWIATSFGIQTFAPEGNISEDEEPQCLTVKEKFTSYAKQPVKLGSDMLSFSAYIMLFDSLVASGFSEGVPSSLADFSTKVDWARVGTTTLLILCNYIRRDINKNDFKQEEENDWSLRV